MYHDITISKFGNRNYPALMVKELRIMVVSKMCGIDNKGKFEHQKSKFRRLAKRHEKELNFVVLLVL